MALFNIVVAFGSSFAIVSAIAVICLLLEPISAAILTSAFASWLDV